MLELTKEVSKLTTKKFSRIGSRGQCYKTILQKNYCGNYRGNYLSF
jgi:hypothetical protein